MKASLQSCSWTPGPFVLKKMNASMLVSAESNCTLSHASCVFSCCDWTPVCWDVTLTAANGKQSSRKGLSSNPCNTDLLNMLLLCKAAAQHGGDKPLTPPPTHQKPNTRAYKADDLCVHRWLSGKQENSNMGQEKYENSEGRVPSSSYLRSSIDPL